MNVAAGDQLKSSMLYLDVQHVKIPDEARRQRRQNLLVCRISGAARCEYFDTLPVVLNGVSGICIIFHRFCPVSLNQNQKMVQRMSKRTWQRSFTHKKKPTRTRTNTALVAFPQILSKQHAVSFCASCIENTQFQSRLVFDTFQIIIMELKFN